MARIAVIGGSGLYKVPDISVLDEHNIDTPWGATSAPIVETKLGAHDVFFLARHGSGHVLNPTEVPYRANVAALRHLGVDGILSIGAVGSLQEECKPGDLVIPDQFIDRTRHRSDTYYESGVVGHVSLADPFCASLTREVKHIIPEDISVHHGGIYLCMEGPQFSTRAESNWYRSMGARIIGMTNLTECRLSREVGIPYVSLSFVTDYDCWKDENVTVDAVLETMRRNSSKSHSIIQALSHLGDFSDSTVYSAPSFARITEDDSIGENAKTNLKYLRLC